MLSFLPCPTGERASKRRQLVVVPPPSRYLGGQQERARRNDRSRGRRRSWRRRRRSRRKEDAQEQGADPDLPVAGFRTRPRRRNHQRNLDAAAHSARCGRVSGRLCAAAATAAAGLHAAAGVFRGGRGGRGRTAAAVHETQSLQRLHEELGRKVQQQ